MQIVLLAAGLDRRSLRVGGMALVIALALAAIASPAAVAAPRAADVYSPALPSAAGEAKAGIIDLAAAPGGGFYAALRGFGRPTFFGLARLEESGAPDPAFGDGGFTEPFADPLSSAPPGPPTSGPEAEAVAVQPDGRVIVAGALASRAYVAESGYTRESFRPLLVRYLPDGSLDPSFGAGGSVTPEVANGVVHDVAVTAEGRIIAAVGSDVRSKGSVGSAGIHAFKIDGSVDASFGRDGLGLVRRRGDALADPRSIVLLPDGAILVSAYRTSQPALARLLPSGRVDRSFGGDGFVHPDAPGARCCARLPLAVGPAGRPTFAFWDDGRQRRVFVARVRPRGGADRSFGGDGLVALPAHFDDLYGITVAGDESVCVAGTARHRNKGRTSFAFAVARIAAGGGEDPICGPRGVKTFVHGIASIAGAALALPDGILVGGSFQMRAADGETYPTALLLTRFLAG